MRHDAVAALRGLTEAQRRLLLWGASEADVLVLDADWESWIRKGQEPPEGGWRQWVMLAGRGFGKTGRGRNMSRPSRGRIRRRRSLLSARRRRKRAR